jgi:hypothetical protein
MSPPAAAPVTYAVFVRRPTGTRLLLLDPGSACPTPDEVAAQVEAGRRVAAAGRGYRGGVPIPARVGSWRTGAGRTALACPVVGAELGTRER